MVVSTPVITVGPTKLPLGYLATLIPRPSSRIFAPWSAALWIRRSHRSLACAVTSGPTSAPGSCPADTTSLRARSTTSWTHSDVLPTNTTVERAMQRCPAAPKAAPTSAFTAVSLLASGMMTPWFLAPMLDCTRLPLPVPRAWMCLPATSPPTKEMARMAGWSQMKFTASCVPWMTFSTPSGTPASLARRARIRDAPGLRSDGFRTYVFPQVMAMGNIHMGIMAGKLKGVMPAHTPSGWRYEYVSMWRDTFSTVSPMMLVAVAHDCSTTSRPRKTSPRASTRVLPCSRVMELASSSVCRMTSSCSLNIMRCRVLTDVLRQPGRAALAAPTAPSISSRVQRGVSASTSCVAGLRISLCSVAFDLTNCPFTNMGCAEPRLVL
mmetsp:Transcript_46345/g.116712  ORF Transcript_46345/g.116712 Transcript_46345/m.116712 type:complete len:380 (+) Transcript_46345:436-1575(+)